MCSLLFAGKQPSLHCLKPLVWEMERVLGLGPQQHVQIMLRFDAGFGTDTNFNWVLWRGYQAVGESYHGNRPGEVGGAVHARDEGGAGRWGGARPPPRRLRPRPPQALPRWETAHRQGRQAP